MRKFAVSLTLLLMLALALGVIGCAGNGSVPEPKDVVPMNVSGFNLVEVSDQKSGGDSQHSFVTAHARFEPKSGSIYWGKVKDLEIDVIRYKDEKVCKEIYEELTQGDCAQISASLGAMLCYNDMFGDASVDQQQGRFLLSSYCQPPLEATNFDEQVLKQAAIEGWKAINQSVFK